MMILVHPDLEALSRATAEIFESRSAHAIAAHGRFAVALCGGQTPRRAYELLAEAPVREKIDWKNVHIFWGDERCVAPDDVQSNYRMAREAFLGAVPIPAANVHRIYGEIEPGEAARRYRDELRQFFVGGPARFDFVLLGLGDDGHTASIFPGSAEPAATEWVVAVPATATRIARVSLTSALINEARAIAFVVAGASKAEILVRILNGDSSSGPLPARSIRPRDGQLAWMIDQAAAARIRPERLVLPGKR